MLHFDAVCVRCSVSDCFPFPSTYSKVRMLLYLPLKWTVELSFAKTSSVDPQRDECPDYLNLIANPMDLGCVAARLTAGSVTVCERVCACV